MHVELAQFLAADERPEEGMVYPEMYGFLFAVCSAPEMVPPSEWMPLILGQGSTGFADEAEAAMVTSAIMETYNEVNERVTSEAPVLPEWLAVLEPPMENFDDEAPLTHWAQGLLAGHDWLMDIWNEYLPEESDEELGACLMLLTFFADRELAAAYAAEGDNVSVETLAEIVVDSFDMALGAYCHIGRSIDSEGLAQSHSPFTREDDKVGRNDPCPCGSGKKFKKCCLH